MNPPNVASNGCWPPGPCLFLLGRSVRELKEEFPTISFDAIKDDEDVYYEALGDERETNEAMADRARELFSWLKERPETNVAVVRASEKGRRDGSTCCSSGDSILQFLLDRAGAWSGAVSRGPKALVVVNSAATQAWACCREQKRENLSRTTLRICPSGFSCPRK